MAILSKAIYFAETRLAFVLHLVEAVPDYYYSQ